ncbi:MAG TPA: RidA family protein [Candidatus Methylomirabilis sp.]|nr:RidA family protein [Candidatus Methylomirabilis sp.]
MKKAIVNADAGKGWDIFKGSGVDELIHSDGVRIDLADHSLLYISGKTATDERGQIVGPGDIKEQTRQVIRNIAKILEANGATIDDIVRVRVYVTEFDTEKFCRIHEARAEFFHKAHYPASTFVVVKGLAREGALIEIDSDAVIPRRAARVGSVSAPATRSAKRRPVRSR